MFGFTDMVAAVNDARSTLNRADRFVDEMARMCDGRLRAVNTVTLRRIKRELSDFNAHTGEWKRR